MSRLQRARQRSSQEIDSRTEELQNELGTFVRSELGEFALDAVEQFFPEQTRARRRQRLTRAFVVGVLVGAVAKTALRRR